MKLSLYMVSDNDLAFLEQGAGYILLTRNKGFMARSLSGCKVRSKFVWDWG